MSYFWHAHNAVAFSKIFRAAFQSVSAGIRALITALHRILFFTLKNLLTKNHDQISTTLP